MSAEWKNAAIVLAEEYEIVTAMSPAVRKAAQLVSELRADIRSLNAVKALGFPWPQIANDLVAKRQVDEAASPDAYAISAELAALVLAQPFPTEREAAPVIWGMAFDVLATVLHKTEVQHALSAAVGKLVYAPPKKKFRLPWCQ